jgi:hypothetical protein
VVFLCLRVIRYGGIGLTMPPRHSTRRQRDSNASASLDAEGLGTYTSASLDTEALGFAVTDWRRMVGLACPAATSCARGVVMAVHSRGGWPAPIGGQCWVGVGVSRREEGGGYRVISGGMRKIRKARHDFRRVPFCTHLAITPSLPQSSRKKPAHIPLERGGARCDRSLRAGRRLAWRGGGDGGRRSDE